MQKKLAEVMAESTDTNLAGAPRLEPGGETHRTSSQAYEHEHEHEHTDASSLNSGKLTANTRSRTHSLAPSRRSRRASHASSSSSSSADTNPLEPLELALSGGQNAEIARIATAATTTSTWSRPPEYEVTFNSDSSVAGEDSFKNPRDWPLWYRMWTIAAVSYSTWVIVLYSTSYTAAIPGLMASFHEENRAVATLGVTTYLLGLATGSLVVAPMSELFGRRPVYLICLSVSTLLILPCALGNSLAEIIVVRFFGALFGAVMICNGAGTIADISTEDDRALYMSLWSIAPLNGPVTGPLVGGFVYQYLGWRWDQWIVLILSGVAVCLMTTVKETYAPVILKKKAASRRKEEEDDRFWCEYDDANVSTWKLMRASLSRPFILSATEPILWFFNIWISVIYGILYLCFVAYPIVFEDTRGWGPGDTGLSFLGIGIGTMIAICMEPVWRKIINRHAKDPETGRVPPEASACVMSIGAVFTPIGQLVFSWTCLPASIPYAIPIAFGIPFGLGNTLCFIYGTNYLAGAYGTFAASALAGNAVMRSIFGATMPLAGSSMYDALTPQWAGTLLGLLELVLVPIPFVFYKYGDRIRARSPVIKKMREEQARQDRKRSRLLEKQQRQRARLAGGNEPVAVLEEGDREWVEGARVDFEKTTTKVEGRDVEKGA